MVFVNTCRLEDYLSSLDQQHRTVVGRIWKQSLVESFGYVVSRDVAAEVVDMDNKTKMMTKDHGEDANRGVSLTETLGASSLADDVTWTSAAGFVNDAAVWFGPQEVARDPTAAVLVLSHGSERQYVLSRGKRRNATWHRAPAVLPHDKKNKERSRLQDELSWCPGALRMQQQEKEKEKEKWRESALHPAVEASGAPAPTRQRYKNIYTQDRARACWTGRVYVCVYSLI